MYPYVPDDLWITIFGHLTCEERANVSLCCKAWKRIVAVAPAQRVEIGTDLDVYKDYRYVRKLNSLPSLHELGIFEAGLQHATVAIAVAGRLNVRKLEAFYTEGSWPLLLCSWTNLRCLVIQSEPFEDSENLQTFTMLAQSSVLRQLEGLEIWFDLTYIREADPPMHDLVLEIASALRDITKLSLPGSPRLLETVLSRMPDLPLRELHMTQLKDTLKLPEGHSLSCLQQLQAITCSPWSKLKDYREFLGNLETLKSSLPDLESEIHERDEEDLEILKLLPSVKRIDAWNVKEVEEWVRKHLSGRKVQVVERSKWHHVQDVVEVNS